MATATRIYVVTDQSDGGSYLIRANHPAQAINRIVRNRYLAESASQEVIVEILGLGGVVIDANEIDTNPQQGTSEDDGQASLIDQPSADELEAAHAAQSAEHQVAQFVQAAGMQEAA